MIEFATLLLGLAAGPQAIELTASDEVAEVRILLDGAEVGVDDDHPWKVEIDLGATLAPHLLEAIAFDASGAMLSRVSQRLNVPRPPAEVRITLERSPEDAVVAARLAWQSSEAPRPRRTRAWLDGSSIPVDRPEWIPIPAHDPSDFHFFQVELEFSLDVIGKSQAVFGGRYLEESQVELTALPVVQPGKRATLDARRMNGWFLAAGSELRVSAVEKGGSDLVLVRGPGVGGAVRALEGTLQGGLASGGTGSPGVSDIGAAPAIANMSSATASDRLNRIMALDEGQRLRILAPQARSQSGFSVAMTAFALSPEITNEHGGLYWALQQDVELPGLAPELRLADATAVAGLQAANGNRRRGVLLVLAENVADRSRHSVRAVRDYLASIQVPLFVWRIGDSGAGFESWGDGENIASFRQLQGAARRLDAALNRQRIVWLEGLHLPNRIDISPSAKLEPVVESPH